MDALEYIESRVSNVWCSFDLWQHVEPQSLARFVTVEEGEVGNQNEQWLHSHQ